MSIQVFVEIEERGSQIDVAIRASELEIAIMSQEIEVFNNDDDIS